ncbi:glutathione peroxidase [Bacillus solitudinis]|uniref:glutathione peroxidase n=1 Tax=Bacillus solitudinis TaxID=2014074 RepID=UPI000C23ED30|nr:glutathione peroxidase [Bacillus solitudinis]
MSVHEYTVRTPNGEEVSLSDYKGQALLIVNTATKCGLTPQFQGLETLYQTYKDEGFVVLGFPCNQFMNQEPLGNEEMIKTCKLNYGVTFPLFEKVLVNGTNAHPLYQYLKKEQKGILSNKIKWNFTKFLVDRNGQVTERYGPNVEPGKIEDDIKEVLLK